METTDMLIRPYEAGDEKQVVDLWGRCNLVVPSNDPQRDIDLKLQVQPELFLVATTGGSVVGSVMAGYEGHRGWINYLAVSPDHQRQGIGRALMKVAEGELSKRGCPKINLQVRSSNLAVLEFYRALGFSVDDVVSMGKRL